MYKQSIKNILTIISLQHKPACFLLLSNLRYISMKIIMDGTTKSCLQQGYSSKGHQSNTSTPLLLHTQIYPT